jgi:hypothetical protein
LPSQILGSYQPNYAGAGLMNGKHGEPPRPCNVAAVKGCDGGRRKKYWYQRPLLYGGIPRDIAAASRRLPDGQGTTKNE